MTICANTTALIGICKEWLKNCLELLNGGGVIVWIVNDATIDGSETGSSFRQALAFLDAGFNLHDTMIWCKDGGGVVGSEYTYCQNFEYMFVFSKGRPKAVNLIKDKINNSFDKYGTNVKTVKASPRSSIEQTNHKKRIVQIQEFSKRNNWWLVIPHQYEGTDFHPAVFPEELVRDHILSWSNDGDLVLDPFMGSGTTAKVARALKRNYIGFDISQEYVDKANKRMQDTMTLFD